MDGSDVFFPTGSFAGRPAFVSGFPPHHGGLALLAFSLPYSLAPRGSGYPGFERYYGGAKTPSPVSPAALASRLGGGPHYAGSLCFVRGTLRASGRRCCPRWPLVTRCRPLRVLVVDWEEGLPCSLGIPACCAAKFLDPARSLPPRHGQRSGFVPDGPDYSGPQIVQGHRWNVILFRGSIARLRNSLPTLRAALSVGRDRVNTLPVTTTQGSLPVARLHAFPPGIWTRLGLRRGVSALKSLQLPMSMCSLSQSLRFCPPCGSVSSSGLPRPQGG